MGGMRNFGEGSNFFILYNMKVVMLCRGGRYKNLVEGIFAGRKRLSKAYADDGFLVK